MKIILLLFIGSLPLFSQENPVYIQEISFTGLKRTKEDVVLQIIEPVQVGSVYTEEVDQLIIQKLRETGIFVPDIQISTELIEGGAFIHIDVKDRWTLIPIPIVSVSKGESWNAGVLAIENNLFGYYKTLGLGFFYGSEGWSFLSFFSDRLFLGSDFEFTGAVAGGYEKVSDLYADESIAREYESDDLSISFATRYPFTDIFTLGGVIEYNFSFPRDGGLYPVSDLNALAGKGEVIFKDVYYDIPYEKGYKIEASASLGMDMNSGSFFPVLDSDFQWSFSPWLNHLISLKGKAGWGNMPVQKQFRLGGYDGSRVLPMMKIAADEYAQSAFIYNLPVWIFKAGTISAKVFYEAGYFKSDIVERTLFHGPGAGLEFFINNLAIPAVGLNLGWNLETGEMQFSAGIGM